MVATMMKKTQVDKMVTDGTTSTNKRQKIETKESVNAKKPKKIFMLDEFHMKDVTYSQIIKSSKCNIVPICNTDSTGSPILVQISGGGKVPVSFGVEEKEDDNTKVNISLQVSSDEDYTTMKNLRGEIIEVMSENWSKWHNGAKKPSLELVDNFCNHFVQPKKEKKNSPGEYWDSLVKSKFNKNDILSGKCRIVDAESNEVINYADLPGRKWHKAVFELRHMYILGTKSFGVTKVLRYLSTSDEDGDGVIDPL
jgi:hypothetical protein